MLTYNRENMLSKAIDALVLFRLDRIVLINKFGEETADQILQTSVNVVLCHINTNNDHNDTPNNNFDAV